MFMATNYSFSTRTSYKFFKILVSSIFETLGNPLPFSQTTIKCDKYGKHFELVSFLMPLLAAQYTIVSTWAKCIDKVNVPFQFSLEIAKMTHKNVLILQHMPLKITL